MYPVLAAGARLIATPKRVEIILPGGERLDCAIRPPAFPTGTEAEQERKMVAAFASFALAHIERVRYEERTGRSDGDGPIFSGSLGQWILDNADAIEALESSVGNT